MTEKHLTIFIAPLTTKDHAQSEQLLMLYQYADKSRYSIATNPEDADLILLTDGFFDNYGEMIFQNDLLKTFTNKCFLLANVFRPLPLFRGIFTSAEKSIFNFGRIRSCSYTSGWSNFRNPFVENHYLSDKPASSQKKFLFSFMGRNCDPARDEIFNTSFKRKDIVIENTDSTFSLYQKGGNSSERQQYYYETLLQSKFALAPRGWSANSYRLFEAMMLGVAPVIISDEWILPKGPDWKSCSLIISSKKINRMEEEIIKNEHRYPEMGERAKMEFQTYFDDKVFFDYVISNCRQIKKNQLLPESFFFHNITPLVSGFLRFKDNQLVSFRNAFTLLTRDPRTFFRKATLGKFRKLIK